MGAVVWNANPSGGGVSAYVRTLAKQLSEDVTAAAGAVIVGLEVDGLEVDQKLLVSFCGTFYFTEADGAIQLYVDGVAVPFSIRAVTAGTANQYHELSYVGVVVASATLHTIEIRNACQNVMYFLPVGIPEATGASLVVAVVRL
jgi:hypothetical protein